MTYGIWPNTAHCLVSGTTGNLLTVLSYTEQSFICQIQESLLLRGLQSRSPMRPLGAIHDPDAPLCQERALPVRCCVVLCCSSSSSPGNALLHSILCQTRPVAAPTTAHFAPNSETCGPGASLRGTSQDDQHDATPGKCLLPEQVKHVQCVVMMEAEHLQDFADVAVKRRNPRQPTLCFSSLHVRKADPVTNWSLIRKLARKIATRRPQLSVRSIPHLFGV